MQAILAKSKREWWWAPFAIYAVLGAIFAYYGKVARDEGWYLYAGWAVHQGQWLYRDFPHFQAPLLAYFYSLTTAVSGYPLELGRAISWLGGTITVFLAVRLARRHANNLAAALVCVSFISSSYAFYHMNYVSNLALSTSLAFGAMYCFFQSRGHVIYALTAVGTAALAAATRLSFLPYALFILCLTLWTNRLQPQRCAALVVEATGIGAACFLPFLIAAPAQTVFNLIVAQVVRRGQYGIVLAPEHIPSGWHWALLSFSLFAFGLGLCFLGLIASAGQSAEVSRRVVLLSAAAALVYLPNLAPGDLYPNYLVPALPFLASSGGMGLSFWLNNGGRLKKLASVAGLALLLIWNVFSSAVVLPRLISFGVPQREKIAEVAQYIASHTPDSKPLFTFETILAVLAHRPVMTGMEMSYFSFFPRLETSLCRRYHLLNDELVIEGLTRHALGAVALTDLDLFLLKQRAGRPEKKGTALLKQFLEWNSQYFLARIVPEFGLFMDDLYIFTPHSGP